ncbi:MAG: NAD(P)/FAD-dependent oxidoreductase [Firmicutes bacterium]|nr:NAD(P)/FAD-dependent oxidoreductase [Bacillota bacterium]
MSSNKFDVLIIGGGIVGCAIAWKLSRYNLKVGLIEKEPDIAVGTTKANTAIIHAGYNANPKTLKGRLNVKGNEQIEKLVKDLEIPFKRIGSLVVAVKGDDLTVLDKLYEKGIKNKVAGLKIVDQQWLRENEPNLTKDAVAALWAPTAGIISPWEYALAMIENAVENNVKLMLETEVRDIIREGNQVVAVKTNRGNIKTDFIINAAGLFSDEIARMVGIDKVSIKPRKGEYILYDKAMDFTVNHVIFPVPTPISKGVVITNTVDNNVLIGPTSDPVASKTDLSTTAIGLKKVFDGARKLFPGLTLGDRIRVFAGLRAADESEDFIIETDENIKGFINVAGIQSPGISSAPAIGDLVLDILKDEGLEMIEGANVITKRKKPVKFSELDNEGREKLIKSNPRYGQIVCRCETVTYQEILDAIHSPVGARTVNAVKRRVRAGMGRCQGGFCGPKVVEILAQELGIEPTEVLQEEKKSYLLNYKIKELLNKEVIDHV